ncbi:unnamed protein product [Polarella glacialis]|uniref:Phosphoribosyltransferase domain-containing protein n=1 Tax=Polarella glacialis TaxID=89957 RepID=A0A813GAV2_POLGL|nr:unnamed protein product [Polarella glacialis]CAE8734916.1 unnamed protein product [Polarella glacialis]
MSTDGRYIAAAALASAAATAAVFTVLGRREKSSQVDGDSEVVKFERTRDKKSGVVAQWTKPVVIASPGLEVMAQALRKRLGCEEFSDDKGPTVLLERFKSNDPNTKFNWKRVVGRKIVFLFDTVDQDRLFEQLALLQALQGFAVPDGDDKSSKWKTYVHSGKYSWGRASHITVVIPWYRPCQMERTSRWHLTEDMQWVNSNPDGEWLDVPCAQYMARLLSTPGSVPPLPGPSSAMDGMPLNPLWRPPLELLFVELHEEIPIRHSVSDLGATIRMERFVPYFLERFKAGTNYPGKNNTFILFPDKGAYDRYAGAVVDRLKLDPDHILFIKKTRVGESISTEQKFFCIEGQNEREQTALFVGKDHVLIIDDFTNSGSTLFGAVNLVRKMVGEDGTPDVSIFVSHLVATYDPKVVAALQSKLHELGPTCKLYTTNSIATTTDLLKDDPQVKIIDISDFIADLVH